MDHHGAVIVFGVCRCHRVDQHVRCGIAVGVRENGHAGVQIGFHQRIDGRLRNGGVTAVVGVLAMGRDVIGLGEIGGFALG